MRVRLVISQELRLAKKDPERLKKLLRPSSLRMLLHRATSAEATWSEGSIRQRQYGSYEDYARHQQSKLGLLDLSEYDKEFRAQLSARIGDWSGLSVLCLAARRGTEVKAFIDRGAFALGVDLNPGKENHYVVVGDFHKLQWPDASVDGVYCNAVDHAFDVSQLIGEAFRVLKPSGQLILEVPPGSRDGFQIDEWGATTWESVEDLIASVEGGGFYLRGNVTFEYPWSGHQLTFVTEDKAGPRGQ